jgi:translin
MINSKFLEELKANHHNNELERREIIKASSNILFESKKTIFALQRQDYKLAEEKLKNNSKNLKKLENRFGINRLQREGSYQAAAEEYLEGQTFNLIIKDKKITKIKDLSLNYEAYIGGICDLIGELVRFATNQAAQGKFSKIPKIKKTADNIMSQLVDFDLTGYLRTKYDQARGHLRKLEQMAYEIKLRNKK